MPHLSDLTPSPTGRADLPRVRLLDVDRNWANGLDRPGFALAAGQLTVPVTHLTLEAAWPVGSAAQVLLSGTVLRTVRFAQRTTAQVLGAGDIIDFAVRETSPPAQVNLRTLEDCSLAALDANFDDGCQRWPSLTSELVTRLLDQERRALLQAAIVALPRVEQRLLSILCHLVERFGHMTSSGARLDLPLSHGTLGQLIGAARPTVSLACKQLEASGAARRCGHQGWILSHEAQALLDGPWPQTLKRPERPGRSLLLRG